jgi:hypothetical protein
MSIKQIFESITPDNIKDIDIIRDAMEIFIENIEKNSVISTDITRVFESDNEYIQNALYETYINSLYTAITKAQANPIVVNKMEQHLAEYIPLQGKITDILNDEYLVANKVIKQKTGLASIIEHTYNLAKYLQDNEKNANDFEFDPIRPFHFNVTGSIYREVYDNLVKPLAHPIGFTHNYLQTLVQPLIDYFKLDQIFTFNTVEVRCLSGNFMVFTPDMDDTNVQADFLTRTNFLTGELFTLQEYNSLVTVVTNKVPTDFITYEDGSRVVKFVDDTIVKQELNPIKVYYRTLADEQANNENYIHEFTAQCSLYVDVDIQVIAQYDDEVLFESYHILTDTYDTINNDATDNVEEERIVVSGGYVYSSDNYYFHSSDNWYFYTTNV